MYAVQHRCMSLKVDVSRTKLIYVIFEFVLWRITIIYLTKHRCIHVRNFVRKKPPYKTHSTVECLAVKIIQSESRHFFRDKICRRQCVLVFLVFVVLREKINFTI